MRCLGFQYLALRLSSLDVANNLRVITISQNELFNESGLTHSDQRNRVFFRICGM
jgi:hypothetical protein